MLGSVCDLIDEYGNFIGELILTRFVILCKSFHIQIAVFYTRGEFLWIGDVKLNFYEKKWFTDVPRAMNKYLKYFKI